MNTGLRSGDLLKLNFEDLRTEKLIIIEGKTKKTKTIAINENIRELLNKYGKGKIGSPFITQKRVF